jgi:pimeloyl-ACP methyl ester carboxylesterase
MTPHPVEIVAQDDCVLRGQVWPGESDWIVLLHDVGPDEDLDRWHPLVPVFLAERLTVLAVDLRGHGASDGEWQDTTAVGDAAAIVRYARDRGAELVVVVAAGQSVVDSLWASECVSVDGVVGLSATAPYPPNPLPPEPWRKGEDALIETSPLPRSGRVPGTLWVRWRQGVRAVLPRAPGIPKLFIVGAHDSAARETTADLRAASIGWALVVTFPTEQHGTELLGGDWAGHVREQILGFVRERRYLARSGRTAKGARG